MSLDALGLYPDGRVPYTVSVGRDLTAKRVHTGDQKKSNPDTLLSECHSMLGEITRRSLKDAPNPNESYLLNGYLLRTGRASDRFSPAPRGSVHSP